MFAAIASDSVLANRFGEIALKNTVLHLSTPTPSKQSYFMEVIDNVYYKMASQKVSSLVNKYAKIVKEYKKTSIGVAVGMVGFISLGTFFLIKRLRR